MALDPSFGAVLRGLALAGITVALSSVTVQGLAFAGNAPEPAGYRLDKYLADVPATLKGAKVVSTVEARALQGNGQTLFIDVMPRPPKPPNLPAGTIWRDMKRDSIPGSVWLPNVGYGRLHETMDVYFRAQLERLTGGVRGKAILFFCQDRCWMSWNAAKRALEYGYTNVIWYPQGTDGWEAEGHALARVQPEK